MSDHGLFSRLRRARIVQVLIVYVGASWAILQLAELLQDSLGLPDWVVPVAMLLLLIGLLVVVGTALVQGNPATDEREEAGEVPRTWQVAPAEAISDLARFRLPHLTWGRSIMGGVVVISLLFGVAGLSVLVQSGAVPNPIGPAEAAADEAADGIAVMPFSVSGVDMEFWQEGLVDLFATNLDGVGGLRAIDSRTVLARWREIVPEAETPDVAMTLQVGSETGARYVMVGTAVLLGGNLRLAATVHDLSDGSEAAQARVDGSPDEIMSLVDELSVDLTRQVLGGPQNVAGLRSIATLTTTSMDALEAYLEGEAHYRRSEFVQAGRAFERAVAEDSTFAAAMARLSNVCGWAPDACPAGETDVTYSTQAWELRARLPARDQALIQARYDFYFNTTPAGAEALVRAVRRYPDDPELIEALAELHVHRPVSGLLDARLTQDRLASVVGLDPTFGPAYIHLIDAYLTAGDSAGTATALREQGEGFRDFAARQRLAFLVALGDDEAVAGATIALDTVPINNPWVGPTPAGLEAWERVTAVMEEPGAHANVLLARGKVGVWKAVMDTLDADVSDGLAVVAVVSERLLPTDRMADLMDSLAEACGVCIGRMLHHARQGRLTDFDANLQRMQDALDRDEVAGEARASIEGAINGYATWVRGDAAGALEHLMIEVARNEALNDPPLSNVRALLMGQVLKELGRPDEAERYLATILRDRQMPILGVTAWVVLAELYEETGRSDEALDAWQKFLTAWKDADPDLPVLAEARAAVARLAR